MAVQTHIDSAFGKAGCFDGGDPTGGRKSEILANLGPFLATILSHPQSAVVGARIEHIRIARGLGESRRRASLRQCDLRRNLFEIVPSVPRTKHVVSASVEDSGIEIGKDKRCVPIESVRWFPFWGRGSDRTAFAGFHIAAAHVSVLAGPIDQIRIIGVDAAHESISTADTEPILIDRAAAVERNRRSTPRSVVLKSAVNIVRILWRDRDVIKLPEGQGVQVIPACTSVVRGVHAAVNTDNHVAAIAWIDPECVTICVNAASEIRVERNPSVERFVLRYAQEINLFIIARIDTDHTEVHRTGMKAVDAGPRFATIGRLVDTSVLKSLRPLLVLNVLCLSSERCRVRAYRTGSVLDSDFDFLDLRSPRDF